MTPQAIIVPAPRRVNFQNAQYNATDAVSDLTYGQLADAMEAGRRTADNEGYARGERAGRGQGIATAKQQQAAQDLAPHTKTHKKLNKQTGILFLGGVIATVGLGTAAIIRFQRWWL